MKLRTYILTIYLIFSCTDFTRTFASEINSQVGTTVGSASTGAYFIYMKGTVVGTVPTCAQHQTGVAKSYVLNPKALGAKALLADIISAKMIGKTIKITGSGNCDFWPNTETVEFVTGE